MSFLKINFTNKNIIELKQELDNDNHIVEFKYIKGKDFKENMLFLEETLIKTIVLIIEENDYNNIKNINNILLEIVNKNVKIYVVENIKNMKMKDEYNYIDKFYLDYY